MVKTCASEDRGWKIGRGCLFACESGPFLVRGAGEVSPSIACRPSAKSRHSPSDGANPSQQFVSKYGSAPRICKLFFFDMLDMVRCPPGPWGLTGAGVGGSAGLGLGEGKCGLGADPCQLDLAATATPRQINSARPAAQDWDGVALRLGSWSYREMTSWTLSIDFFPAELRDRAFPSCILRGPCCRFILSKTQSAASGSSIHCCPASTVSC